VVIGAGFSKILPSRDRAGQISGHQPILIDFIAFLPPKGAK
jgi:hypothetical protein